MRRLAGVVLVLALVGLPGVQRHARLRGIGEAAAARGATPAVTLAGLLALWGLHGGEARALQALPGRCGPHSREALAPDGMHCICSDTSVCFGSRCKTGHKKADPNFVVHGYPREQVGQWWWGAVQGGGPGLRTAGSEQLQLPEGYQH